MPDDEFDLTERERIRWALIDYMKAHKIGVPTLAERIRKSHPREMEIPWKTLQRFLAGIRTRDMGITICKAFVEKLPNRPSAVHALGEALYALYGQQPNIHSRQYAVFNHVKKLIESDLMISRPSHEGFLLATEVSASETRRIHDGVLVFTGSNVLAILKDRLLHTARVHGMQPNGALGDDFYGIVYDNGPIGPQAHDASWTKPRDSSPGDLDAGREDY